MPELTSSQGWIYLQQSKLDRRSIFRSKPKISPAPLYKTYSGTPRYELPRPRNLQASLFKALSARRSRRDYGNAIAIQELADLLWACQGITARAGKLGLRTAPSAGALYPLETYLLVLEAEGLPKGTYHFNCEEFSLELLREGDFSKDMAEACLNQQFMGRAGVDICWSAIFRRSMNKYGHRGMRYILMDAGHACQNLLLAAEVLRLAACPVGAFFDEEVNALFDLDGEEESAVYCTSIGARAD